MSDSPKKCRDCGTELKKLPMGWYCKKCGTITSSFLSDGVAQDGTE